MSDDRDERVFNVSSHLYDLVQKHADGASIPVQIGFEGDPQDVYRGSTRPTGVLEAIDGDAPNRMATVRMDGGATRTFYERCYSGVGLWEPTAEGYEVLNRNQQPPEPEPEPPAPLTEYRGSADADMLGRLTNLEEQLEQLRQVTLAGIEGVASEVYSGNSEAVFCGALAKELRGFHKQYRGTSWKARGGTQRRISMHEER